MANIPAFRVPPLVGRVVARLPQLPPTLALVGALNLALGRILPRDDLEPLTGKRLQLDVTDAGLSLRFTLSARGFRPRFDRQRADLTLRAATRDYLALALREEDADTLFFSRRLIMEGDTDLGLLVKNTLDAVDWDALIAAAKPATLLARVKAPRLGSPAA
ncbi:ubiquinone anaerobic biosynthesis accessory factor UbiT [Denitromonas iodatirespirans]|nr:SCP2 sterol-binding domain-containing protein [Denitromonas iodatirespirans]